MPVFNTSAKYLLEAVKSVLCQSRPAFELIIVNDGSTRKETIFQLETISLYAESGESCTPINIINQSNKKISGALNTGIRNMNTDWWAGAGSDDLWHPDKLKKQVEFIKKHPEAKVVYCDMWYINKNGEVTGKHKEPGFNDRLEAGKYIIRKYFGAWGGMVVHRDVFDTIGLFNEEYPTREDYEMNIRILNKYMMYRVPEKLHYYRIHGEQLTSTAKKEIQDKYRIMAKNLAIEYFGGA